MHLSGNDHHVTYHQSNNNSIIHGPILVWRQTGGGGGGGTMGASNNDGTAQHAKSDTFATSTKCTMVMLVTPMKQLPGSNNGTDGDAAVSPSLTKPDILLVGNQIRNVFLPHDKPKRACNAYNFIFQHEQKVMLQQQANQSRQLPPSPMKNTAAVIVPPLPIDLCQNLKGLDPHKGHGMAFARMAHVISQKWHTLDAQQHAPYIALEEQDKE